MAQAHSLPFRLVCIPRLVGSATAHLTEAARLDDHRQIRGYPGTPFWSSK